MGKPNWGLESGRKRSGEVTWGHPDSSLGRQGHQKLCLDPGVVAHICNPSQHGGGGDLEQLDGKSELQTQHVPGQHRFYSETLI